MKQRIISGVIIALAVVGLGLVGSYPLLLAILLCSLIGYMELTAVLCTPSGEGQEGLSPDAKRAAQDRASGARASGKAKKRTPATAQWRSVPDLIAFPGLILTVLYYAGLAWIEWRYGLVNRADMIRAADFWTCFLCAADFLLTMGIYVHTFPRRNAAQASGAFAAFLYVPVMMSYICRTRNLHHGIFLYLLVFVCASISDVCALAVGMAVGRHKLAPVLSPKKTIEGAIGGVAGSAAVSCLVAAVLRLADPSADLAVVFLIIGICGSIIGQTGDLSASAIKRNFGIKDYGDLIPGHGGIMDRFDSIIFTAPVIYYLSFLLVGHL